MTFAQFIGSGTTGIIGAVNIVVVPLIFAFAFLVFIWGVVNYFFLNKGDETKRAEGKQFVFWGILGMVLLFSVWGFVNLLLSTLGITPGA
jgi:Type IV secretion system pilin